MKFEVVARETKVHFIFIDRMEGGEMCWNGIEKGGWDGTVVWDGIENTMLE